MSITEYDNTNKSLNNIYVDLLNSNQQRFRQRRSLDYGKNGFILAGPNRYKSLINSNHNSIPSSPSYNNSNCLLSSQFPRSQIFIRRQSSERCLIKRHSVDSNQSNISDPGYSLINNNPNCADSNSLFPSNQRSPKDSNSPLSYHSSAVSVTGRNESYVSINILSRQNSINSSNHIGKQSNNDLENRKWFSSSSVILTRVKSMKDKFRRVVVQSVQPDDWPPPSILFSEKYKYSSCQSTCVNTHTKSAQVLNRDPINLVKSKSIDQSTFPSFFNNKKLIKGNSLNSSGRQKRGKLQRSMTSYSSTNDQLEHINNSDNGIVCTDFDLKSIINNFKREEATSNSVQEKLKLNQNVSKTPTATSSVLGPGFGKRKLMRKQVSFDDEQGITVVNRKVSAIAEEIECQYGSDYDRKNSLTTSKIENIDTDITKSLKFVKSCPPETTKEDESEHLTLEDSENVALLQILPKEIEFDEFGQTWEIYGADPDPEILGQAIQNHLERLMICRKSLTIGNGNANVTKSANSVNSNRVKMKIKKRFFKPLGVDLESSENHFRLLFRRLCGKWSCFSHDSQQSTSRFHSFNQKLTVSVDNES